MIDILSDGFGDRPNTTSSKILWKIAATADEFSSKLRKLKELTDLNDNFYKEVTSAGKMIGAGALWIAIVLPR